jgi:hypothetical protein
MVERAGMTVDSTTFEQAAWRLWPSHLADANGASWTGQLRSLRAQVLRIAERRHEQNESIRLAKATGKPAPVPEPSVRQHVARQQQRQLQQIFAQAANIWAQAVRHRAKLRLVDPKTDSMRDFEARYRRRQHMLDHMDEKTRIEYVTSKPEWREAVIEEGVEPEEAGLPASFHARLRQEAYYARFPDDMRMVDTAMLAHEVFSEAFSPVLKSVEAELVAAGAPVNEPVAAAEPAQTWE